MNSKVFFRFAITSMMLLLAHQAQAQAQAPLSEALSFLKSRLIDVSRTSTNPLGTYIWMPAEKNFDGTRWTWNETEFIGNLSSVTHILGKYSVDVRNLTFPVVVDQQSITFECRATACIATNVETTIIDAVTRKASDATRIVKNEPKNTWHFNSEDEAKRVARAMNDALQALGASKRSY